MAASDLKLSFGGHAVNPMETLTYEQAQQPIVINWPHKVDQKYIVAIWDEDSPHPGFVHYFAANATNTKIGDRLIRYMSPQPPSGTHRYNLAIYEMTKLDEFPGLHERDNTQIESVVAGHRLVYKMTFKVASR